MGDQFVNGSPQAGEAQGQDQAPAQPSTVNLDGLSEFEFQGQKLTPDRLQEVFQGYERAKGVANEDRYWANLDTDIDSVIADPKLAERFKSVYPEKFHRILDRELARSQGQSQQSTPQALPKEFTSKVDKLEQALHQMAVESANAKLDALLPKLYEKYPMAIEDQVLARAESLLSQGMKLTDQTWERLAKESHELATKKADAFYKKQLEKQTEKGLAGRDVPPGGVAPGRAPNKPRTFAEAESAMIEHLKANGIR